MHVFYFSFIFISCSVAQCDVLRSFFPKLVYNPNKYSHIFHHTISQNTPTSYTHINTSKTLTHKHSHLVPFMSKMASARQNIVLTLIYLSKSLPYLQYHKCSIWSAAVLFNLSFYYQKSLLSRIKRDDSSTFITLNIGK